MPILLHISLTSHFLPVLQVIEQKVQKATWTMLRPPTTTTAAAPLSAAGKTSALKHASASWTCAAPAPTMPKTQTLVRRRQKLARLSSWSNDSVEQRQNLMERYCFCPDSLWHKVIVMFISVTCAPLPCPNPAVTEELWMPQLVYMFCTSRQHCDLCVLYEGTFGLTCLRNGERCCAERVVEEKRWEQPFIICDIIGNLFKSQRISSCSVALGMLWDMQRCSASINSEKEQRCSVTVLFADVSHCWTHWTTELRCKTDQLMIYFLFSPL